MFARCARLREPSLPPARLCSSRFACSQASVVISSTRVQRLRM
ncbi:MAG TPA: hypothetical protein VH083_11325 [Myxococcales bacterium]|nr:hypothetical protein [Myxococcales bacterium]